MKTDQIYIELNIDYNLLREQKGILLKVINLYNKWGNEMEKEEVKKIDGLINIIDEIQDHAVENLGYTEKQIFNL